MGRSRKTRSWSPWHAVGGWLKAIPWTRLVLPFVVLLIGAAGALGMVRLEGHVEREVLRARSPSIVLVDLPPSLTTLASNDLHEWLGQAVRSRESWLEPGICQDMVERLRSSGWVAAVQYVRRNSDGLFEVSCRYRVPAAMVEHGTGVVLVDAAGVRLPGVYAYDPSWKLIQGVRAGAPSAGESWPGDDLRAGLQLIQDLAPQPFAHQISAVIVDNYGGRVDARASHIELATDQAGGRIRWGSAPGKEVEENSAARKMAILNQNFRRTGRVDAGYLVIDISTFPDRFSVSG